MAGSTGDVNALAAQVLVVSVGELLLTFPYGLSLSAAAFVGNALGANRPKLAKSNAKIFFTFSFVFASTICIILNHFRHSIITLYGASVEVRNLADPTIRAFSIAFFFDWMQNSIGGVIKGVGKQGIASLASFFCLICLNFPMAYIMGLRRERGLPGLWVGFGISAVVLAVLYTVILVRLDWKKTALEAAEDETKMDEFDVNQLNEYNNAIELT